MDNIDSPLNNVRIDGCDYHLRPLSRGGCAQTYLGEPMLGAGQTLVFKVPHPVVLSNDYGFRQWQQECELLCGLRHPAIPFPVAIRSTPRPFLAYRYLPGCSLRSEIARKRFDRSPAVAIALAMLRVLSYLHRQVRPIAHGDVRPENVLMDRGGYVRLIDFGCARYFHHQSLSPWIAAPRYLSPEQAQGTPWNGRSDIYQTGLVLYELITQRPYNYRADARQAILHAAHPPRFPRTQLRRIAGRGVCHWLEDALSPSPQDRIPSAHQAAELLLALLGTSGQDG